jgi:hypothetical protein
LVDDLNIVAGVGKHFGQVKGGAAAAQDHHISGLLAQHAQTLEQLLNFSLAIASFSIFLSS